MADFPKIAQKFLERAETRITATARLMRVEGCKEALGTMAAMKIVGRIGPIL